MLRKVVEQDPRTGTTRERYADMGPSRAEPGHGRGHRLVIGMPVGAMRIAPATGQGR
jgi:hypothetical protein